MSQCTAKSKRSGKQCLKWAVRGRATCHMHGGTTKGPITKAGKERSRQAALRHGGHTKQVKDHHREMMAIIRQSKNFLQSLG